MYTIGRFAEKIGKTVQTLRNWDKKGILKPAYITKGKHRMYSEEQLISVLQKQIKETRINIGYARVSARHQSDDLTRQKELLELYLTKQGIPFQIISDIGSGINYKKQGLKELLKLIASNQVSTVYVVYKDRLLRFGNELLEEFCRLHGTKIEVINCSRETTIQEELVDDILNIIHVFSCRMNGKRSKLNKQIIEKLKNETETSRK